MMLNNNNLLICRWFVCCGFTPWQQAISWMSTDLWQWTPKCCPTGGSSCLHHDSISHWVILYLNWANQSLPYPINVKHQARWYNNKYTLSTSLIWLSLDLNSRPSTWETCALTDSVNGQSRVQPKWIARKRHENIASQDQTHEQPMAMLGSHKQTFLYVIGLTQPGFKPTASLMER